MTTTAPSGNDPLTHWHNQCRLFWSFWLAMNMDDSDEGPYTRAIMLYRTQKNTRRWWESAKWNHHFCFFLPGLLYFFFFFLFALVTTHVSIIISPSNNFLPLSVLFFPGYFSFLGRTGTNRLWSTPSATMFCIYRITLPDFQSDNTMRQLYTQRLSEKNPPTKRNSLRIKNG